MLIGKSKSIVPKQFSVVPRVLSKSSSTRIKAKNLISELVFIRDYTLEDFFAGDYSKKAWWEN